jgi:hypothetical protein
MSQEVGMSRKKRSKGNAPARTEEARRATGGSCVFSISDRSGIIDLFLRHSMDQRAMVGRI